MHIKVNVEEIYTESACIQACVSTEGSVGDAEMGTTQTDLEWNPFSCLGYFWWQNESACFLKVRRVDLLCSGD